MMMDFKTYYDVLSLYSRYGLVCDSDHWHDWPDFFTSDGIYKLQPRENYEQGLPLCLLSLESQAMMQDRVFGMKETMYHDPYYQRHIIGIPTLTTIEHHRDHYQITAQANYTVIRTKFDQESMILSAGFYDDLIVSTSEGFKFKRRLCVYDTEMIANSIIYPI